MCRSGVLSKPDNTPTRENDTFKDHNDQQTPIRQLFYWLPCFVVLACSLDCDLQTANKTE